MTRDTIRYSIALSRGLLSTVERGPLAKLIVIPKSVWSFGDHSTMVKIS